MLVLLNEFVVFIAFVVFVELKGRKEEMPVFFSTSYILCFSFSFLSSLRAIQPFSFNLYPSSFSAHLTPLAQT
jgi:hypothetical protein